jgi:23S rRNA (adenine2030-N6)-methyltransferase
MRDPTSRYRPDAHPDYSHRFHAGNVGDVWKHCALIALLDAAAASAKRVAYLETHAGEGVYDLGATGEWTEGVGRLVGDVDLAQRDDALGRYVSLCRGIGGGAARMPARYPGSPIFARAMLGPDAPLALYEREEDAFRRLSAVLAADPAARLVAGDGLDALEREAAAAETAGDAAIVAIDPPWSQKADWIEIPDALVRAIKATTQACFMLWYPVKSLTRPNAMIARLAAAGVSGLLAELVTTPLEERRNRLNGSGVLLVRAPESVAPSLAAAAPMIARRCATRSATWSFRLQSWGGA